MTSKVGLGISLADKKGNGSILPFSVNFSALSDGALPSPWSGSTWSVVGGNVINTPTLGSNLFSSGDMETGDPPTGMGAIQSTLSSVSDERTGGSGSKSVNILVGAFANGGMYQHPAAATTAGTWFVMRAWTKNIDGEYVYLLLRNNVNGSLVSALARTNTSWTQYAVSARATDAGMRAAGSVSGNGLNGRLDDMQLYELSLSELLATREGNKDYVVCARIASIEKLTQVGAAGNISGSNFVIGYSDGVNIKVDECVSGTYTNKISAAKTYYDNMPLTMYKSGDNLRIFWGHQEVGSAFAMNAATKDNTGIGMFSTWQANKFSDFTVYPGSQAAIKNMLAYGDSKTTTDAPGFVRFVTGNRLVALETPTRIGATGRSTALAKAAIDSELASASGTPDYVLYNLGANDAPGIAAETITESDWKTNTLYILDAMKTKWSNVQVYIARVYVEANPTACDTLAAWQADVVALRPSFCHLGIDERDFLPGNQSDGIHPNTDTYAVMGDMWRASLGY